MGTRYTKADVRQAFDMFVSNATLTGFNVEGWHVHNGNSSYKIAYTLTGDTLPTGFPSQLGYTAAEAVATLRNYADALRAVRSLQGVAEYAPTNPAHTMSAWAESRRHLMTPDTIAANERLHAESIAAYGPNYEAEEAELIKR